MKKIIIHACCGPCSIGCLEKLKNLEKTFYFSNDNIDTKEEWTKRLENLKKIQNNNQLKIIEKKYNHKKWKEFVKGNEKEQEGGNRCMKCFEYNLRETAKKAKKENIPEFTTTLTISKYKPDKKITEIGKKIEKETGIKFLEINFKGNNGYERSIALSKELKLYRQKYCGCEFSNPKNKTNFYKS